MEQFAQDIARYERQWEEDKTHEHAIDNLAQELYNNASDTLKREALVEAVMDHDELLLSKMDRGPKELGDELIRQYKACLRETCKYLAERKLG